MWSDPLCCAPTAVWVVQVYISLGDGCASRDCDLQYALYSLGPPQVQIGVF